MNVLEIIDVRVNKQNRDELIEDLNDMINGIPKQGGKEEIKVYKHFQYGSDFSVHLSYQFIDEEKLKNELGVRLAEALKEFGLVNHSVWVESKSIELKKRVK